MVPLRDTVKAEIGEGGSGKRDYRNWCAFCGIQTGLDHGAGHSLLLLCDAKTPRDKKSKEFKALGHYPCNVSIGLL